MTINDQIRDEKLQYDINRKAAEISALSSGKIDKYEYLTGEEILPSNQQQIIEQAKFTYSPLGKAFEKQIQTIEDQGEKTNESIWNQGQNKTIKKQLMMMKIVHWFQNKTKIFNKLADELIKEITDLDEKVDSNNLIYSYNGNTTNAKFHGFFFHFSKFIF